MPGAMRKMGIYLGLVEDDENRAQDAQDEAVGYDDAGDAVHRSYSRGDRTAYEPASDYRDGDFRESYADRGFERDTTPVRSGYSEGRGSGRSAARSWSAESTGASYAAESADVTTPRSITTLHPRTYNEAKQIGEAFRDGVPVIMNLTEMNDADAKRLVDFAAGLIFGLRGDIERVTNKVFLLSPQNVTVTAEDKARIAERGFFNQS